MTVACTTAIDGLSSGHAYTAIGVNEETGRVIIRNPWAEESYTGEGSDQTDDGLFEVPIDTFKNAFAYLTILAYKDWKITNLGAKVYPAGAGNRPTKLYWEIYNDVAQEVAVTIDVVHEKFIEGGCDFYDGYARIKLYEGDLDNKSDKVGSSAVVTS